MRENARNTREPPLTGRLFLVAERTVVAVRRRRRGGTFDRPVSSHPELRYVNDGGHDAPLTPRARVVFRGVLVALFVAFAILLVVTLLAR